MSVIDVDEQTFQTEVIERSHSMPVVVDFWAEWCGPCRALSPVLESAAAAREGKLVLAKLDTDANPSLSGAFAIQGIPAVKAFRDGKVVDEFVGAQPPAAVDRFLDGLLPSEAEPLVAAGDEQSLRRALEFEPGRADATVALARLLHARGEDEEALRLLDEVPGDFQVEGLAARIRLEQSPDTPAVVADGWGALDGGESERGLDLLLSAIGSAAGARDDVRRVIVAELDRLGVDHPVARDARRRLAAALY